MTAVVDDKLVLRITPKAILKNNTDYEFVVQKKANRALTSDMLRRFHTAPELLLSGFQLISNTVGCVYSNSDLGDTEASGSIVTNPLSRKPTITQDYGQNIWNSNGSSYTVEYTCPQVSGKIAYIVDLRLDPERPYSITFGTPITDTYNQHLAKPTAFTTKTGPISPKDQYLYSSLNGNQTQVIPSTLPVILGLLSINIDTANIDVCEMDQQEYLKYLDWERNTSSVEYDCKNKVTKKIPLKNHFWTQTPTKIDIEKDVLGHALITPFIYIHGYISDSSSIDSQKQFTHVFLRSNLSLAFEDGKNSRILFASSYDAKTLPPDLTFEAYNWTSAGTWMDGSVTKSEYTRLEKFPIVYDAKKQIYTIADPDIHFDLLIAKNKDFYGILDMNSDQTSNYDFKYISGMDASNRDYLYIYPERPLYKRGDTVSFKGILRSYAFDGYHLSAVKKGKLKILSPQGESLTDMDITLDEHSNFHGSFLLPETAPFGRYSFEFVAMDEKGDMITPYTNGEFFLDAYKKPVFKVVTDPLTPDVMVGATTDVHGHAEYYF